MIDDLVVAIRDAYARLSQHRAEVAATNMVSAAAVCVGQGPYRTAAPPKRKRATNPASPRRLAITPVPPAYNSNTFAAPRKQTFRTMTAERAQELLRGWWPSRHASLGARGLIRRCVKQLREVD